LTMTQPMIQVEGLSKGLPPQWDDCGFRPKSSRLHDPAGRRER
jgi:hypothetical protein